MTGPVFPSLVMAASAQTGRASWAQFVQSFRRTAEEQLDLLPAVGVCVLIAAMVVINWQIAKRVARMSARPAKPAPRESALVEDADGLGDGPDRDDGPRRAA